MPKASIIEQIVGSDAITAQIIISIGLMLSFGFLMTRVTKKLKLPNVTAYIVVGILMGPFVLNLIPQNVISKMDFLSDIALAFIAFSTGEFFKLSILKKNGSKVIIITIFESLVASFIIFLVTFLILKLDLAFAIVLSALAAATAPASTVMTIRQTGAKGDFVNTLLQVVALDDVVGLLAYSIAISVALASSGSSDLGAMAVIKPIIENIIVILIGIVFGFGMKLLMTKKRTTDNRLIIAIAFIFLFCGICALVDVSPLLGCMVMGTVYVNSTNDDKLFKQLNYFSPPILLLFFVRSGLNFNLDALFSSSSGGSTSLIVVGVVYFFVRIIGKYLGAFLGCLITKKSKEVRNYLGLALIPQAGVAIGLAALGARTLGEPYGDELNTIILASSVLYELIGPACAKASLYLSKSYSNNLDEITNVNTINDDGTQKSDVEILIERIQEIQKQIPSHDEVLYQEENAFTEAAEEYINYNHQRRNGLLKNHK